MKSDIIVITQRCDFVGSYGEQRDALDVNWTKFINRMGYTPILLPSHINEPNQYLKKFNPRGIILSGGNDIGTVKYRDKIEETCLEYAISNEIPVLGVCRGMQMLNLFCGGQISKVSGHVGAIHEVFSNLPMIDRRKMNSFHNYGIFARDLSSELEVIATAEDGSIEAIQHTVYPWLGIMWHPERDQVEQSVDIKLIKNLFEDKK